MKMPFGKHQGRYVSEIPLQYLEWIASREIKLAALRRAIDAEIQRRGYRHTPAPIRDRLSQDATPLAAEIITLGYRELSKRHHPDKGGRTRTMQLLNEATEYLRHQINGGKKW